MFFQEASPCRECQLSSTTACRSFTNRQVNTIRGLTGCRMDLSPLGLRPTREPATLSCVSYGECVGMVYERSTGGARAEAASCLQESRHCDGAAGCERCLASMERSAPASEHADDPIVCCTQVHTSIAAWDVPSLATANVCCISTTGRSPAKTRYVQHRENAMVDCKRNRTIRRMCEM